MKSINIREGVELDEKQHLHPKASLSSASKGRSFREEKCAVRTDFQRDRDRIIHSKAFRRLNGKTQVFFAPAGDHFRTRLTHTLEVSQIARTISRALKLNEDLTEAISLGHDLGHTPFGHTGEEVLSNLVPSGFHHSKQSLRVVDVLERDGNGLNLCHETRDGILHHTKGEGPIQSNGGKNSPKTLEGEVVRFSDVVAYVNHDVDDTIRAGVMKPSELPKPVFKVLGDTHSKRISNLVNAILRETNLDINDHIVMEEKYSNSMEYLRRFLFEEIYLRPDVRKELEKAKDMLEFMWGYFTSDLGRFKKLFPNHFEGKNEIRIQDVVDFIAGMTDVYAIEIYENLFVPQRWYIL
jgi:dGTPase